MSYLVLARKWRPRSFAELVGQEHVRQALVNALDSGRVHHAFLFTGTRGVGKTTIARILARSLNCERGVSSKPCGECGACREIDEGRFVDLIEVDAASRTKVDDTRELLENVQYLPNRGRFKVYLIDEVHMLSAHSFNALLKTLEEPPPHVKFLLATTDPQKLPVTVLSRCLQFNLKRLPASLIAARLSHILGAEGVTFEAAAVQLLARAADGSLRDALSLLDQMLAFGGGRVTEAGGAGDARHGGPPAGARPRRAARGRRCARPVRARRRDRRVRTGLRAAARRSRGAAAESGASPGRSRARRRRGPCAGSAGVARGTHARRGPPARLSVRDPGPTRPRSRSRSAHRVRDDVAAHARLSSRGGRRQPTRGSRGTAGASARAPCTPRSPPKASPAAAEDDWPTLLGRLELKGPARQLAGNCQLLSREGNHFRFLLDERASALHTRQLEDRFVQALRALVGDAATVEIERGGADDTPARREEQARDERLEQARAALERDPAVQALRDRFGAVLQPDSIKPVG